MDTLKSGFDSDEGFPLKYYNFVLYVDLELVCH